MESTHSVLLNLRNKFFTIKSKKLESAKIQFLYIGRVAVYACVYFTSFISAIFVCSTVTISIKDI